jgi:hypothetical protein
MKRHTKYLSYVLRHKWHVFWAALRLGVNPWQAFIHDWHKFLPSEWMPYAYAFYDVDGSSRYRETDEFNYAWNLHQKRGRHHWQHWLLTYDRGSTATLPMEDKFVREMVADWIGAGLAITGKYEAPEWYKKNKSNMLLHHHTRYKVECLLIEHSKWRADYYKMKAIIG